MALSNLQGSTLQGSDIALTSDNGSLTDNKLTVNTTARSGFRFGSGAGRANKIHTVEATISGGATLSLDLDADTLTDPFGNTLAFANIKSMRVSHSSQSLASQVSVQGSFITSTLGASTTVPVPKGGSFAYQDAATGLAVTASTGDVLEIVNNDGSNDATVTIELIGV